MEDQQQLQQLPNSTAILVLGILSIPLCCCFWGVLGIGLGIVAIVMSKKAIALYDENPDMYSGIQNVKTGRLLAYIGVGLGVASLILNIVLISMYGMDGLQEMYMEKLRDLGM